MNLWGRPGRVADFLATLPFTSLPSLPRPPPEPLPPNGEEVRGNKNNNMVPPKDLIGFFFFLLDGHYWFLYDRKPLAVEWSVLYLGLITQSIHPHFWCPIS